MSSWLQPPPSSMLTRGQPWPASQTRCRQPSRGAPARCPQLQSCRSASRKHCPAWLLAVCVDAASGQSNAGLDDAQACHGIRTDQAARATAAAGSLKHIQHILWCAWLPAAGRLLNRVATVPAGACMMS